MAQKVAKAGVKREKDFLYFVDKQGDISRAKMARGGKRRQAAEDRQTRTQERERIPVLPRQAGRRFSSQDGSPITQSNP